MQGPDAKDECARSMRDNALRISTALFDMLAAIVSDAESVLSPKEQLLRMDGCR